MKIHCMVFCVVTACTGDTVVSENHSASEFHILSSLLRLGDFNDLFCSDHNTIEEDIKERIMAGNKAFYANRRMFQEI